MIALTTNNALTNFINIIEKKPESFIEVGFVSPYLNFNDAESLCKWRRILKTLRKLKVNVFLVTRKKGSRKHNEAMKVFKEEVKNRKIIFIENLHAKVYMAIGKKLSSSYALLTSANLTKAGMSKNFEASLFLQPPYTEIESSLIFQFKQLYLTVKRFSYSIQY